MKHCIICWQQCKTGSKYCLKCSSILRDNRTTASNISKRLWKKLCPICFKPISHEQAFCVNCNKTLQHNKQTFNSFNTQMSDQKEYIELEYTYVMQNPKFFRRNRKDYVTYDIIELWLRTGHHFTQNLEILYKEWLPKRNRFQSKEKYFKEYIIPIARKQYERWRMNAIWFWVDVAVEAILQSKPMENGKESNDK